jgi:6-pyruvoyl-tetrahydropterin synthase
MKSFIQGRMFVRDIDHLDCAVFHPLDGIVGATWHVDVELSGKLDHMGFIFDFGKIKKKIKEVLKNTLDHTLIVPELYEGIKFSESVNQHGNKDIFLDMTTEEGEVWRYSCPRSAVYLLPSKSTNAIDISRAIQIEMAPYLPDNVEELSVILREEEISLTDGVFKYTHGLAHHDGGCQRLFHGHRSRLEIFRGSSRAYDLEKSITEKFLTQSIHIVSSEQLIKGELSLLEKGSKGKMIRIGYQSLDGEFFAEIPAHRAILIHQSSSIESIAQNFGTFIAGSSANQNLMIRCYEGINKGGIAFVENQLNSPSTIH